MRAHTHTQIYIYIYPTFSSWNVGFLEINKQNVIYMNCWNVGFLEIKIKCGIYELLHVIPISDDWGQMVTQSVEALLLTRRLWVQVPEVTVFLQFT
jgi:hypothetical protein